MAHPVTMNYKGHDSHSTRLGGVLTILVRGLVIFELVRLSTNLVGMTDPSILSFVRPLYDGEITKMGEMKLSDYHFGMGVYVTSNGTAIAIPENLGRFITEIQTKKDDSIIQYPAVNCSDAFTLDIEPGNRISKKIIPDGYCADRN